MLRVAGVGCAVCALPVLAPRARAANVAPAPDSRLQTIGFSGALPDLKTVEINNGHVYDYTFATAPTDWWVQSGVWQMTNRWNCSPGWSWFGGRSNEVAAVWNKRRFAGDISVQYYYAFKMGLSGSPRWHEFPADAAVTICGDGKNLSTGYTFIMGADQNKHTLLLRNGKIVAESTDKAALLPVLADGQPGTNELHRRWWYVRMNRIGSRVECWLDNALIFSYDDPQPLDRRQLALWTYNNGIMLSRVQIYYQNEVRPDYRKGASAIEVHQPSTGSRSVNPRHAPLIAAAPRRLR
jgi:hypothetical protein